MMLGYLDVVIRDKRNNKITIIDIKTSTMGWNKYQKADKTKTSQLVLYKKYFAEQYGFDVENIDFDNKTGTLIYTENIRNMEKGASDDLIDDNPILIDEYGSIDFMNTVRNQVIKWVLR